MSGSELKQRLAAILAADVAGYSLLMAADDRATVAALDAGRAVFRTHIEANQGRVIDMAGDSVLAVFETATGAVLTALAVQQEIASLVASTPEDRQMRFRIGVHLGDVIEKSDGTIYGDGVNIAARLEGLAEPGGIAVSESIRSAVKSKVSAGFEDQGEQTVKNILDPVRVYRIRLDGAAPMQPTSTAAAMPRSASGGFVASLSDRPSIAVLPFRVLSEDSSMSFLADGLVEDVTALLARVAGFVVISHGSAFAFRNSNIGVQDVARQLGVRYIVTGSVRPLAELLRVSTQLVEGVSGRVLWSGQFESGRADTPNLQDVITRGILSELEPELTRAEIASIKRLRPENIDAWGCYMNAQGAMALKGWTEEAILEAREQYQRAFEIDPAFALARANFALITALGTNTGLLPSESALADEARDAAEQAIALDDGSSQVLGYAGCALSDLGDYSRGAEILTRAVELDPSNAQAYVALGAAQCVSGESETGIENMRYGIRISPRDRRLGFWGWALGSFLLRASRPIEALQEARRSAARDPKLYLARILEAASLQSLGRPDEGRQALRVARRLRTTLTAQDVALSHGRQVSKLIEQLWDGQSI